MIKKVISWKNYNGIYIFQIFDLNIKKKISLLLDYKSEHQNTKDIDNGINHYKEDWLNKKKG